MDEVGRTDGFFDLGGDSLLAARILSCVRDRYGMELRMSRFFDEPTVAALALR